MSAVDLRRASSWTHLLKNSACAPSGMTNSAWPLNIPKHSDIPQRTSWPSTTSTDRQTVSRVGPSRLGLDLI
eukprot:7100579-Alexandrium_andersonii.AAC.1